MNRQNFKSWGLLALAISPIIVTFSGWQLAKAQLTPEMLISVNFPQSGTREPSGQTSGGGSRGPGDCASVITNLTALMPGDDNAGTTTVSNPKFFVYLPQHQVKSAQFEIKYKSGESVYSKDLDISNTSGIVKLSLPENVSLKTNQEYSWSFSVICDSDTGDSSANRYVEGTITKVEISPELEKSLKNATPLEQAAIYAKARIWNETIATLAELRNCHPGEWEELLTSVGLQKLASEPFASCCQLEEE
ncbi:DUF928 domain-containing protein [Okeania sp.]|uniref:DUF928 domain-containing protein n=1 Tax=Okeania sp. TaxID=3100323 RepID=UPI002B4AE652|nr:DUF928 domain-containing protein [Okeania sp.]MEB3340256.1 DUF928 domain-containing protein [Okeania sp.]